MLRAYSKDITVNANTAIPFNTDKFDIGNNISHQTGSGNIIIHSPGFYEINFSISFTTVEEETNPISIQLYANGVAIPDAIISTSVSSTTTYKDCSFNTIIRAIPGVPFQSVILTIVPTTGIQILSTAVGVDQ